LETDREIPQGTVNIHIRLALPLEKRWFEDAEQRAERRERRVGGHFEFGAADVSELELICAVRPAPDGGQRQSAVECQDNGDPLRRQPHGDKPLLLGRE